MGPLSHANRFDLRGVSPQNPAHLVLGFDKKDDRGEHAIPEGQWNGLVLTGASITAAVGCKQLHVVEEAV